MSVVITRIFSVIVFSSSVFVVLILTLHVINYFEWRVVIGVIKLSSNGLLVLQCQSHQIFHMFVLVAAFVHYHGISQLATNRLTYGECGAFDLPPDYPALY